MSDAPSRSIFRQLLDLSTPIIGLNVLSVLALAIDTAMCGRLENADSALTALSFAVQVIFLLMVAMMGLTVGTVALVARAHGAGQPKRVDHILLQSTQLTILLGLAVAVIGNVFAKQVLLALGASQVIAESGLDYLRPLLTGTTFYYLTILYGAVLRGVGNTRLPFVVALASTAINVFFNYGLILGNMGFPAMGLRGAAFGTLISYAFSVIAMVVLIRRGAIDNLFLSLRPAAIDKKLAGELFRIGSPAALDMVILNAAFLSIVGMLARVDEVAVAAHGIGLRIQGLAFVPGLGVAQATGAMVGQALGAGDPERAKKVVHSAIILCSVIMTSLAVVIVVFVYPIVGIFDVAPGTPLETYSVEWIRLLGYGMPIVGVYIAFVGMLQGSGATATSLRINFFSTIIFQIPLSALLGFTFGLGTWGIWIGFPISFVLKAAMNFAAYKRGDWAKVGLRV